MRHYDNMQNLFFCAFVSHVFHQNLFHV